MRVVLSLPANLVRRVDRAARRLSLSRSDFESRAVAEFLKTGEDKWVTDALRRVYAREDSRVDPIIERMQSLSLEGSPWDVRNRPAR